MMDVMSRQQCCCEGYPVASRLHHAEGLPKATGQDQYGHHLIDVVRSQGSFRSYTYQKTSIAYGCLAARKRDRQIKSNKITIRPAVEESLVQVVWILVSVGTLSVAISSRGSSVRPRQTPSDPIHRSIYSSHTAICDTWAAWQPSQAMQGSSDTALQ
jgi:hypothetical protein